MLWRQTEPFFTTLYLAQGMEDQNGNGKRIKSFWEGLPEEQSKEAVS
jgi:hypothetical protein